MSRTIPRFPSFPSSSTSTSTFRLQKRLASSTRTPPPKPQWPSRTHLLPPPSIPPPVPAKYPQKIQLSDGSTFTIYTTAPTPAIIRLTRDVTNNPLWAPGTERRGLGEGSEEGRVGRFRRRFEGVSDSGSAGGEGETVAEGEGEMEGAILGDSGELVGAAPQKGGKNGGGAFAESDFDWMSEGAKDETVSAKEKQGKPKAAGKKK